MTTNNNLDALFADAELPFHHPGRRFDDTPELSEHSPLLDQGLQPDHTPHEDTGRSTTLRATSRFARTTARPRSTPATRTRSQPAPTA